MPCLLITAWAWLVVVMYCVGTAKRWLQPLLGGTQGDHTAHPTAGNYTFKVALEEQNITYNLDLCPSQLKQVRPAAPLRGTATCPGDRVQQPVEGLVPWLTVPGRLSG